MVGALTLDWLNLPDLTEVLEFWTQLSGQFTDLVAESLHFSRDEED